MHAAKLLAHIFCMYIFTQCGWTPHLRHTWQRVLHADVPDLCRGLKRVLKVVLLHHSDLGGGGGVPGIWTTGDGQNARIGSGA